MTIRAIGFLAITFVVPTCIAQSQTMEDSYLLIRLKGDGKAYEYTVDLMNVRTTLRASCEDPQSSKCPIYTGADKDTDLLAVKENEKIVRSQIAVPYFSRVALDTTRTLILVANTEPKQDKYTFEIFKLPGATPVKSGTTIRRISDAEWVGTRGCFVLLTSTSTLSFMPWHWLAMLAGHPPQYNTYFLELYAPDGSLIADTLVHKEIKYSAGGIIKRRAFEATTDNAPMLRAPC